MLRHDPVSDGLASADIRVKKNSSKPVLQAAAATFEECRPITGCSSIVVSYEWDDMESDNVLYLEEILEAETGCCGAGPAVS